jgi:hypothetical protein
VGFVVKKKEPQRTQRRHRGHKEEVLGKTLGEFALPQCTPAMLVFSGKKKTL